MRGWPAPPLVLVWRWFRDADFQDRGTSIASPRFAQYQVSLLPTPMVTARPVPLFVMFGLAERTYFLSQKFVGASSTPYSSFCAVSSADRRLCNDHPVPCLLLSHFPRTTVYAHVALLRKLPTISRLSSRFPVVEPLNAQLFF